MNERIWSINENHHIVRTRYHSQATVSEKPNAMHKAHAEVGQNTDSSGEVPPSLIENACNATLCDNKMSTVGDLALDLLYSVLQ